MKRAVLQTGFYVLSAPIGSALSRGFFKLTEGRFRNDKTSKLGNAWWYGYLYNFACRMDLEKIKEKNKGFRAVRVLMPDYDYFFFYNTVFHFDCISHIIYELSQGYIPVIDDHHHVWSQFFEQPILSEALDSADLSSLPESDEPSTLYTPMLVPYIKPVRKLWSKLIKQFCTLKKEEAAYIENEIKGILRDFKVLGIVCRGTDYIGTGMPIQPKTEDVIAEAKTWMDRYGYEKIYLATEDERIYDQFSAAFPCKILVNKRTYYDKAMKEQNVQAIGLVQFARENDNYWKGLEYLSSIYILSRCDALLAGYCGATHLALLLNDDSYDRFKVYDLG